jgi:hypothetical protein
MSIRQSARPTVPGRLLRLLPTLSLIAIIIGLGNFAWFFAESSQLGGDALNGYSREGHYFVSSHGTYNEVDRAAWEWSRMHAISVFITHPAALLGMYYLGRRRGLWSIGRRPDER